MTFEKFRRICEATVVMLHHSLGVARKDMPQIQSKYVPEFLEFLQKKYGIHSHHEHVEAEHLKPIQKEVNLEKAMSMPPGRTTDKPMVVSKDSYILDGHHRWYYALMNKEKLNIVRVDTNMLRLLELAKSFDRTYYQDVTHDRTAAA